VDISTLSNMVNTDAAIRRRQKLQPVGGQGDKIFPPTYPGEGRNAPPQHVFERRRLKEQGAVESKDVWCVLVDSVQSQANRLEESLLAAIADGLRIPHVVVDFSEAKLDGITRITSLDAPHRVYDAILRDSLHNKIPFPESEIGKRLTKAKLEDASALLEVSPTALLFGAWHSTGEGGGLGAKFARCIVSEIVGVGVPVDEIVDPRTGEVKVKTAARRPGSRMDPLGVLRKVEVFKGESGWDTSEKGAGKKAARVRPSEINHGNIAPSIDDLGATCDHIEHSFVLSFAALRRLRFGSEQKNKAARALLAALGLVAVAEQDARGYALRSRCDLVCDGRSPLHLVKSDGTTADIDVDREKAKALYNAALGDAKKAGFELLSDPLVLSPQNKLVEIVRRSQELALSGAGGENNDSGQP